MGRSIGALVVVAFVPGVYYSAPVSRLREERPVGALYLFIDATLPVLALMAAHAFHRKGHSGATVGLLVGAGLMLAAVALRALALAIGMATVPEFGTSGWNAFHYVIAHSHLPSIAGEAIFLVSLVMYARGRTSNRMQTPD